MKWNRTTIIGIQVLMYLAAEREPAQSIELSQCLHVSRQVVIQDTAMLQAAGLVYVISGNRGGYCLAKSPEDITLHEVIVATEGQSLFPERSHSDGITGTVDYLYDILFEAVSNIFKRVTIQDLVREDTDKIEREKRRAHNATIAALSNPDLENREVEVQQCGGYGTRVLPGQRA